MSIFNVRVDTREMQRLAGVLRDLEAKAPRLVAAGLNTVQRDLRPKLVRELRDQTGAKYGDIRRALRIKPATIGNLEARINVRGAHMPMGMFAPRVRMKSLSHVQTRNKRLFQVVSAAPWAERRTFPGVFMVGRRSGRGFVKANTSAAGNLTNGQVFVRVSDKRFPIRRTFGPALPKEIVKDDAAAAFLKAAEEMPKEILRLYAAALKDAKLGRRFGVS